MTTEEHNQIVENIKIGRAWYKDVLYWIKKYYSIPGNECGGSLHILLDDDNIEDHFIQYCKGYADGRDDKLGSQIANIFSFMTEKQRARVLDIFWNKE